ncbi:hypothetical protein P152DRAFT_455645 [Eremomyces bilateralis CBS 781.70]|uniref:Ubiquitin-like-conjugating enzyme ATG10 n=1 Tax=Eremomyces bilateralis CBS 781.70 TaxID=1392243 RepID=A0A6G1GDE9_9PEZI|nr:uncharacterized protein P152DRAFT_455645 [Eremomyces bilateralis CBS 781.70]KAF1815921.1 hypothetical protein P152DRAFT_455645 [Eremomyces bilateralis CBS 781.70]
MSLVLPSFPLLSSSDFQAVCSTAIHELQSGKWLTPADWNISRLESNDGSGQGLIGLRIIRALDNPDQFGQDADKDDDELLEEHDTERLSISVARAHRYRVFYDIMLSPSMQMPVVWFSIHRANGTAVPLQRDVIIDSLVPTNVRSELTTQGAGPLGGISQAIHPNTGFPAWYIHPCETANALREVRGDVGSVHTDEYLRLWMGVVGPAVGLYWPQPR